ncbi:hypothetical protein QF037_009959 [Streptomyces canus]|uniref:hypothetical protein n=1 Tax=Streptomyces canus TaxID=58343 RepID=UPI0027833ECE|nr:hypothetical protein [Streptomyces canus]MDQ0605526.1 hypothetical protein [Streptomyces canus]
MASTIALRKPLDDNGLPHHDPTPPPALVTETSTAGGCKFQITPEGMTEIFERLRPYLPPYLKRVQHSTYALRFEFAPFTGRESDPSTPDTHTDPKLAYGSDDKAERALRRAARGILDDLYEQARQQWRDAAYVADLQQTVKDTGARWQAYERENKALESAYDYLRTPAAATDWPSALSRLVDAQERALAAASAFDDRAWEIARVHDKHLYADLGHHAALARAGYPEATDWHITLAEDYGSRYYSEWSTCMPLTERVRRLISQQDTHVTKVGRLSGTATGLTEQRRKTVSKREWTWPQAPSPRGMVLSVLGIVTLGVAILSMAVSYQILEPRFGAWAVPTVGALDALWVVFQATEILSGNNKSRALRVQIAGLALTVINAAIPTADLIMRGSGQFELAVILTPIAIVATKTAWLITLPSLGRKVSADTQQAIAHKRQLVADQLETMEAEAAHRIELLKLATELERRVAEAETEYRKSVLEQQQAMTEDLHTQAEATAQTITEKVLPASVAAIRLPELGQWTPTAPALPAGRDASGTDGRGRHAGQDDLASDRDGERRTGRDAVALAELAAVAGVPTPQHGEPLTDGQLDVVLRHLRYRDDPPMSQRKAGASFRQAGFIGSEERVRRAWNALLLKEGLDQGEEADTADDESDREEEPEDADA